MPSKLSPIFGRLPTHLDLPSTDDKPLDNGFQLWQAMLLMDAIIPHLSRLHPDGRYYLASDHGIYYQITDPPLDGCKAPDWFYVPNVSPSAADASYRNSYVMWQELVRPAVVMEFVSDSSRGSEYDRTPERGKFWVYERVIGASYYVIYDPREVKLEVYHLDDVEYELMQPDERGFYLIKPLNLNLGMHYSTYGGCTSNFLRWFDLEGELLPTNEERVVEESSRAEEYAKHAEFQKRRADQEREIANREKQHALREKERADLLAAKLRELGVDPDSL